MERSQLVEPGSIPAFSRNGILTNGPELDDQPPAGEVRTSCRAFRAVAFHASAMHKHRYTGNALRGPGNPTPPPWKCLGYRSVYGPTAMMSLAGELLSQERR
jgi:hypothetical protein